MIRRPPLWTSLVLHAVIGGWLLIADHERPRHELHHRSQTVFDVADAMQSGVGLSEAWLRSACPSAERLTHATTMIIPYDDFAPLPPSLPYEDGSTTLVCVHVDGGGRVDAITSAMGQDHVSRRRLDAFARSLRFHPSGKAIWLTIVLDDSPPAPSMT